MIEDWEDDLGARLRAANPAPHHPRPLTAAEVEIRDRITGRGAAAPTARARAHRRWFAVLAPIAAIAVLVIVMLNLPTSTTPAVAALTPPQLAYVQTGASVADVLRSATAELTGGEPHHGGEPHTGEPHTGEPQRGAHFIGWYYQAEDIDTDAMTTVIAPTDTTLHWDEDLSGVSRTVAGVPYWADGSDEHFPESTTPPGTLISELTWEPGEFQPIYADVPGAGADDIAAMLTAYGMTDPTDAYQVMSAAEYALQIWTLTDAQQAGILDLLAATHGASVLGTAVDRTGRPITGISAPLPGGTAELHLLISAETGRIVGSETLTLVADHPFPADAIIAYTLWDAAP